MTAYDDLRAHLRQTAALGEVAGRLGWDQQTVMPRGANDQRAEEMARWKTCCTRGAPTRHLGELIGPRRSPGRRWARRSCARRGATTPATPACPPLASELARVTALSQTAWEDARAADDVAAFLPWLEKVVALRREEGQAIAQGGDAYDALMQDYEPGSSAAQVGAIFDRMRPRLVDLARPHPGRAHAPCPARPFPARRASCGWRMIWPAVSGMISTGAH